MGMSIMMHPYESYHFVLIYMHVKGFLNGIEKNEL